MKGLEVSEVKWSYVKSQSDVVRFDSYYYAKEFLSDENIIARQDNQSLKELKADLLSFGAYSLNNFVEYKESGIPFIRGVNMKDGVLDFSDTLYIDETAHKLLWKSEVKPNTILLSMSGTIGDVAIAMPEYKYPMNSNQDIAKITLNDGLNPYYLYAFLRSKYGQNFLKREARGSVQQHVFLSQMENIRVPLLTADFQQKIETLVKSAHAKLAESKSLYAQAEDTLLCELGLKDWQPKNEAFSIKSFSDFASSGRLDAEYYQSKYDEIEERIKTVPYKTIAELQTFNARGVQPDYISNGTVSVVNSKHILENGLDYDNFEKTTTDFLKQNERATIKENDILIYTTGANIGRAQPYLLSELAVASNHVNILRLDGINPLYAAFVLNSKIGRLQTEKMCTGSAQAELYPSDIEKFLIPILPSETQNQIAKLIQTSFALRQESKRLLESAKLAVEREIENP